MSQLKDIMQNIILNRKRTLSFELSRSKPNFFNALSLFAFHRTSLDSCMAPVRVKRLGHS